jgi:hypothetical protein
MDLALKMLTDLLWAPLPQTLDPLLCKWFGDWTIVWLAESKRASREVRSMLAADPLCMHVLTTARVVWSMLAADPLCMRVLTTAPSPPTGAEHARALRAE